MSVLSFLFYLSSEEGGIILVNEMNIPLFSNFGLTSSYEAKMDATYLNKVLNAAMWHPSLLP